LTPEEKLRIIREEANRFYQPFYDTVHKCPYVGLYDDAAWLIFCGKVMRTIPWSECKECPVFKELGITIPRWPRPSRAPAMLWPIYGGS